MFQHSDSAPIRELLQRHGLRTSLNRIKVLNALALAVREGRAIDSRGVHAFLQSSVELSLVSVREVLKRLEDEAVILCQDDKTYRFTHEDWAILKAHYQAAPPCGASRATLAPTGNQACT